MRWMPSSRLSWRRSWPSEALRITLQSPKNLRVRALELWRGELAPAPVASAVSAETWLRRLWAPSLGDSRHKATEEDPLELAEKLGPEPVEAKKPEPLRRRLVLTEDSDGP